MPVILYRVWAFVAPALYKHERQTGDAAAGFQYAAVLYRYGVFAYFVVFSAGVCFLDSTRAGGRRSRRIFAAISGFLSWRLFIAFGVSFEVLVAIVLLCWMGVTTPEDLRKKRPYMVGSIRRRHVADAAGCLRKRCWRFRYRLFEIGFLCAFLWGKRLTRDDDAAAAGRSGSKEENQPPVRAVVILEKRCLISASI